MDKAFYFFQDSIQYYASAFYKSLPYYSNCNVFVQCAHTMVCMCMCMHEYMPQFKSGGQRKILRNWFPPFVFE